MFTTLARLLGPPGVPNINRILTSYSSQQWSEYLEMLWRQPRSRVKNGGFDTPADLNLNRQLARIINLDPLNMPPVPPRVPAWWHHIIYAYMLENTRIVDVFQRVLQEWLNGERLPWPSLPTQRWMRTTEELFFTTPRPSGIGEVTSNLRPDAAAVRRNAYYRLLGMDLNHGTFDNRPYPYVKPETSNRDFAAVFESLLREAWRGYINRRTTVAQNTTDDQAIREHARHLRQMLLARRENGILSREEFNAVAMLDWFRLALLTDTQVVQDLTAQSTSPAARLAKIAERVGVTVHTRSDSYFQLAAPISLLLLHIENGNVEALGPQVLYADAPLGVLTPVTQVVATHWEIITGRPIKDIGALPTVPPRVAATTMPTTMAMPAAMAPPFTMRPVNGSSTSARPS